MKLAEAHPRPHMAPTPYILSHDMILSVWLDEKTWCRITKHFSPQKHAAQTTTHHKYSLAHLQLFNSSTVIATMNWSNITIFKIFSIAILFIVFSIALIYGKHLNDRDKSSVQFAIVVSVWTCKRMCNYQWWFVFYGMHKVFRHGERSPSSLYPNDPHKNFNWTDGYGALTQVQTINQMIKSIVLFTSIDIIILIIIKNDCWHLQRGAMQAYKLGMKTRTRYDNLMQSNGIHAQNDLYVMSSSINRCVKTAEYFLTGFLPNADFHELPITIHSIPTKRDKVSCSPVSNRRFVAWIASQIVHRNHNWDSYFMCTDFNFRLYLREPHAPNMIKCLTKCTQIHPTIWSNSSIIIRRFLHT